MIIPILIIFGQVLSIMHLYNTYKHGSGQIPAAFIELNILGVFNIIILIIAYFCYFKSDNKLNLWYVPIGIASLTIFVLLITYVVMLVSKYK